MSEQQNRRGYVGDEYVGNEYYYQKWTDMLRRMQEEASYSSNYDVKAAAELLDETIARDCESANRKDRFFLWVLVVGVVVAVGTFTIVVAAPEVMRHLSDAFPIIIVSGIGVAVIGGKARSSAGDILVAAHKFRQKYMR